MKQWVASCSLVVGLFVAGCDHLTGVRVMIHTKQRIDPACIPGAQEYLGPVNHFARLNLDPGIPGELYSVVRDGGNLNIVRYADEKQAILLEVGWIGPPRKEDERLSIRLLEDVERAVLQACVLNSENSRIERTCEGRRVCREAGIKK